MSKAYYTFFDWIPYSTTAVILELKNGIANLHLSEIITSKGQQPSSLKVNYIYRSDGLLLFQFERDDLQAQLQNLKIEKYPDSIHLTVANAIARKIKISCGGNIYGTYDSVSQDHADPLSVKNNLLVKRSEVEYFKVNFPTLSINAIELDPAQNETQHVSTLLKRSAELEESYNEFSDLLNDDFIFNLRFNMVREETKRKNLSALFLMRKQYSRILSKAFRIQNVVRSERFVYWSFDVKKWKHMLTLLVIIDIAFLLIITYKSISIESDASLYAGTWSLQPEILPRIGILVSTTSVLFLIIYWWVNIHFYRTGVIKLFYKAKEFYIYGNQYALFLDQLLNCTTSVENSNATLSKAIDGQQHVIHRNVFRKKVLRRWPKDFSGVMPLVEECIGIEKSKKKNSLIAVLLLLATNLTLLIASLGFYSPGIASILVSMARLIISLFVSK